MKLANNRPNVTAWKDDTPEQTKKVIILGDSIVKRVRGYDLSHSLEKPTSPYNSCWYKRYINKKTTRANCNINC